MSQVFNYADIYGHGYGATDITTRDKSTPDHLDQQAIAGEEEATADLTTTPKAKRNMTLFVIIAIAVVVLFSIRL